MQKSTEERLKALEVDAKNFYNAIVRLEQVKDQQRGEISNLKWLVFLLALIVAILAIVLTIQQPQVSFAILLVALMVAGFKAVADIIKTE
jgi:Flp pilus assembly protein TadB